MHTITIRRPSRGPVRTLRDVLSGAFSFAFGWLIDWQARASERAHLGELSDHLLRDVGLTREQLRFGAKTRYCTSC